jgi:hypothetical protein
MQFGKIAQNNAVWQGFRIHVSEVVSVVVKTQYYGGSWPDFLVFSMTCRDFIVTNKEVIRP